MSLLMQALKKAERARQSGLQEEDVPVADMPVADVPVSDVLVSDIPVADTPGADMPALDMPYHAPDSAGQPAADDLLPGNAASEPAQAGGLELSLEPLGDRPGPAHEAAPPRAQPPSPPPSPIQPAMEASHNPVPPQARHEGGRRGTDAAEIPVADARPAPGPAGQAAGSRRGPAQPERRILPRTVEADQDHPSGIDMARLRLAGLAGILAILAGTFGYVYWQAVNGPGPGASLPMVPMPPPSATGATSAAGDGAIVVAPSGPPFGPLGTAAAGTDPATAAGGTAGPGTAQPHGEPAAAPSFVPSEASPAAAELAQPAPRGRRTATAPRPTAEQLAAIADPEVRREAQREAEERASREARLMADATFAVPSAGGTAMSDPGMAYAPAGTGDVHVARSAAAPAISPAVQAGYAAFGAGDLATARQQYAAALRQDPNNRDALLGSAVIAARERRDDDAAGFYTRLLAANPRDAEAIAGLAGLRPGDGDRAEIRLKGVLRNNEDTPSVHFALGNLYARQGRWQEAQQAYFRAWSAAPGNADYAFNLAVGLDRLNQGRLARDYYGRALALSAGGAAAFDRAAVQRRLQQLAPGTAPGDTALPAPTAVPAPAPADAQVPAAPAGN